MKTVVCLGASITAAKGSFNWIEELSHRYQNKDFKFYNFGVGGDLAYNVLQRLPDALSLHPDNIVIIVGHNDALSLVSKKVCSVFSFFKHLPEKPSPDWYCENVKNIIHDIKNQMSAKIAIVSLSPIGEDLESQNPFQKELNIRIKEYNSILKEICQQENITYIPFYEILCEKIAASPIHTFSKFNFLPFYRDTFCLYILKYPLDKIAQINKWKYHTDGIHLNSSAGSILANLVQTFLDN